MSESWGFETKQVHAGASPDPVSDRRFRQTGQPFSLQHIVYGIGYLRG